jgi:hypothetical protein
MDVNREHVQLWVEALESGEFEQGRNQLRNPTGLIETPSREIKYNYCCLGVAVEVALRNGYVPQEHTNTLGTRVEEYDHMSTVLWPGVVTWYGFDSADPYIGLVLKGDWNETEDGVTNLALITEPGKSGFSPELSATQANDDHHATFQQIAAGLRAKYLAEASSDTE